MTPSHTLRQNPTYVYKEERSTRMFYIPLLVKIIITIVKT